MGLDSRLLEILACPEDRGPLLYFADEDSLYNPRLHRRYAVRDGIPIMLIDEAETVDDAEHGRLMAKAEADGVQPTFEDQASGAPGRAARHDRDGRGPRQPGRPRRGAVHARADGRVAGGVVGPRRPARPRRHRERGRAGHGRQRGGRRRAGGVRRPVPAGPRLRRPQLPGAGLRRRGLARLRHLLLRRHRGDHRGGHRVRPGRGQGRRRHRPGWRAGPAGGVVGGAGRAGRRRHPAAPRRPRGAGRPAAGRPRGHGPVPRRPVVDRRRHRAAEDPPRPAAEARQPGRGHGPGHRPHHPPHLRRRAPGRGRRLPLEDRPERERQGARLLEHPARAVPQRALGVGPARRRHPADRSPSSACGTTSSTPR